METTPFIRNNFLILSCYPFFFFFNMHVLEKGTDARSSGEKLLSPFYPSSSFPCD